MNWVTTQWVLAELAAYLSDPANRPLFVRTLAALERSPGVEIVHACNDWFKAGMQLYANRPDKSWSLVDCISFRFMEERHLNEAFTADQHFQQAGFVALLRGDNSGA